MPKKPIHVGPGELFHAAPNGCSVIARPVKGGYEAPIEEIPRTITTEAGEITETIRTPVLKSDGWEYTVFDVDGEPIGKAYTLGKARQIARNGGQSPPEAAAETQPGGKRKGR